MIVKYLEALSTPCIDLHNPYLAKLFLARSQNVPITLWAHQPLLFKLLTYALTSLNYYHQIEGVEVTLNHHDMRAIWAMIRDIAGLSKLPLSLGTGHREATINPQFYPPTSE